VAAVVIMQILIALSIFLIVILYNPTFVEAPEMNWYLASTSIKKAMRKMGPLYDYKLVDGILYVSVDNRKVWKRLRY